MKAFKDWIIAHKLLSIVIAAVIVVGAATAIVLPIALKHEHTFDAVWSNDGENHWHACTDEGCKVIIGKAAHTFTAKKDETRHWKECATCGYKVYTSISEERYENALNFKDEDGEYYNDIDIVFINGTTKVRQYKVTENAAYKYSTAIDAENLETIWTNENGKGVIYTKKNAESKWVRTEYTEPFEDIASFVLPVSSIKNYTTPLLFGDKLTYNETDQMYHGSYEQSSAVTVAVSMKFENGKLVELSHESTNSNNGSRAEGTRTITYGNAVIEIPNADEVEKTIYVIPYSEENGFTVLSILSAGDNWFMIEITSEMLGSSAISDIQATFSVKEGDTLPTLTFAVEDASGTAFTDGSGTNGSGYFEGLTAGKYYIKITTAEDCPGTLSVNFG